MSTIHDKASDQQGAKRATYVNFIVSDAFRFAIENRLHDNRKPGATGPKSLRAFCTEAIAEKLGIPVPGESPAPAEKKRRT